MKSFKRKLALMLAFVMILASVPFTTTLAEEPAEEEAIFDDFTQGLNLAYAYDNVETLVIQGPDIPAGPRYVLRGYLNAYSWREIYFPVYLEAGIEYVMGARGYGSGAVRLVIMYRDDMPLPVNTAIEETEVALNPSESFVVEATFTAEHTGYFMLALQDANAAYLPAMAPGTIYVAEKWVYAVDDPDTNLVYPPIANGDFSPWLSHWGNGWDHWDMINVDLREILGGGDQARLAASGDGPAYIVYGVDAPIWSVSVDTEHGAVNLEASADGINFEPLTDVTTGLVVTPDAELTVFEHHNLPEDTRFVRINLEAGTQVDAVYINSRTSPVAAIPGALNERYEHQGEVSVTLTARPNATIYFSLNQGEPQVYTAPIRLTGLDTIVTWASEPGLHGSIPSTFTFFNTNLIRVDRLGQMIHAAGDFPTWVDPNSTDAELQAIWADDEAWLAQFSRPDTWDIWGGLAGSGEAFGFEATGFFRVENYTHPDGRVQSFMINPLGNIYFNNSPCVVHDNESFTAIEYREEIYEWLPVGDPDFATAWRYGGGAGAYGRIFSFYIANWIRRHGEPYTVEHFDQVQGQRLYDLGFTGVGAWGHYNIRPYMPEFRWVWMPGIHIGWSHLWDVFHPDFEDALRAGIVASLDHPAYCPDDPSIVGFMMGNERYYDHLRRQILYHAAEGSGVRVRLIEMLQELYPTLDDFNAAWELEIYDWDNLLWGGVPLNTHQASLDMDAFYHIYFDRLYGLTAYLLGQYYPNHMLLGCRWHTRVMANSTLAEIIVRAAGPHLGAMTWNLYAWDLNLDQIAHLYEIGGQTPFMLTEFHYGDISTGLTFGVRSAVDESEKGSMFRNYVERAAYSGHVVGVSWFTWLGQAPTGRHFEGHGGEAGAIGFFNVMDRPYRDLLYHVTTTNYGIYDVILRNRGPHRHPFEDAQIEREGDQELQIPMIGGFDIYDLSIPWEGAAHVSLDATDIVMGVLTNDISAEFFLAWYGNNLYFRADITEPTPMRNVAAWAGEHHPDWNPWGWIWASDAIELFIGPDRINEGGGMHRTDIQLLFGAHRNDDDPASPYTIYSWYNRGQMPYPPAADGPVSLDIGAALWADETGYSIAARIPLSDIVGADLEIGRRLRFDMAVSVAVPEGDRTHQLVWNGTAFNSSSRERWGMIELVDTVRREIEMTIGSYEARNVAANQVVTMDVAPMLENGEVLVPVYFVGQMLGAGFEWNGVRQEVTMTLNGREYAFRVGEYLPDMDVTTRLLNNRVFVPLSFIAQWFDVTASFDPGTGEIRIIM